MCLFDHAALIHHPLHQSQFPPRCQSYREAQLPQVQRNVTAILGTDQKPSPNLFSFDTGRLAAIESFSNRAWILRLLSLIFSLGLWLICAIHVRVTRGSGSFLGLVLESRTTFLVTLILELYAWYTEPQAWEAMYLLCCSNGGFLFGPLNVKSSEVHGPGSSLWTWPSSN